MAFAHYPTFCAELWRGMRSMAQTQGFVDACARLPSTTEDRARRLGPVNLRPELLGLGYHDPEPGQIADRIDIFSQGNMPYVPIATAARVLLEGQQLSAACTAHPLADSRHLEEEGTRCKREHTGPTRSDHCTTFASST